MQTSDEIIAVLNSNEEFNKKLQDAIKLCDDLRKKLDALSEEKEENQ